MKLTVVTGNPNKAKEVAAILGTDVDIRSCDIHEIQSFELEEIVREKAKAAQAIVGGGVLVEDVAFDVSALGGFPGPFVKFWEKNVGHDRAAQIAEALGDDKVTVRCGVGYSDGEKILYVESKLPGRIVSKRGDTGFGFDFYFVPDGHDQAFSEMGVEKKNTISHRRLALDMMREKLSMEGILP